MAINNVNGGAGGSATTTDQTPTTVARYAINDNGVVAARACVVARLGASGEVAVWDLACAVKRHSGGGATMIESVEVNLQATDACHRLWSASLKVSGNNLIVQVKGEASATIDWSAEISTREMYIT